MRSSSLSVLVKLLLAACAAGSTLLVACDDDDDGAKKPAAPAELACNPENAGSVDMGSCTAKQIEEYYACATSACEATFDTCYGTDRANGNFDGACAPFMECAQECGCNDGSCVGKCSGADECAGCLNDNPCGTECLPNCASQPGDKTCDDLAECCDRIRQADSRADCQDVVRMSRRLGGVGDNLCNAAYQGICPYAGS